MRKALALLSLCSALATPVVASAQTAPKIALKIEKSTLDNGLQVIFHEDHRTPVVAVDIWYHVGSKDEPAGKNGFAHLFEHLMFQGSKNVPEDMYFKYLERAGASDVNGSTNADRTNYHETVPSNELATALWLESDRMGTLLDHVDQKTFAEQREVVKNERRQNYENAPYGLVSQFIHAAVYPENHPYHLLTIGTPHDLDAATLDDVRAFFKTYYLPNNATLVIAGDFEPGKAMDLVKKYFGPIAKGAAPPTKTQPITTTLDKQTRLDVEAEVELPRISFTWPTPAYYAPGDADLDLLASVMADGRSSRLYKRLVYDLQVAQDVGANQESEKLGSLFEITVTVKAGKKADDVLKIVDEEIDKLRKKPPSADELARAKTRFLSGKLFGVESVSARAELINSFADNLHDPNYFDKDLARYENLTTADLQAALAKWLPKDKRVVTVVTPTKGAPRAGRLVGGK